MLENLLGSKIFEKLYKNFEIFRRFAKIWLWNKQKCNEQNKNQFWKIF